MKLCLMPIVKQTENGHIRLFTIKYEYNVYNLEKKV